MEDKEAETAWAEYAADLQSYVLNLLGSGTFPIGEKPFMEPRIVAATLLIRTLSNFKAMIILTQQGMLIEARTLARCCVENLFWLSALRSRGVGFVEQMVEDDVWSRDGLLKVLGSAESDIDRRPNIVEIRAQFNQLLGRGSRLDVRGVSKMSILESAYAIYKQISSDAAHPSITALRRYLEQDEGELAIKVQPNARKGELSQTIYWGCITMLGASLLFSEILGGTSAAGLGGFSERLIALRDITGVK